MKPESWFSTRSGAISAWLATLICCGVAAMAWFAYRAAAEWQRSSALLVERRTRDVADLLAAALTRDMRAVQVSVLDSSAWDAASLDAPYDVNDLIAGAFARYPYPESFFAWRDRPDAAVFFVRTERRPRWLTPGPGTDYYPVQVLARTPAVSPLIARVQQDVAKRRTYSIFDTEIAGEPYQVIAQIRYRGPLRDRADGVLGYVVNLNWARDHYFSAIVQQTARVVQASDGLACTVTDDEGHAITGMAAAATPQAAVRQFPLFFFDPTISAIQPPSDLRHRVWTITVNGAGDSTLAIAASGARRTLLAVSAGALALGVGLLVTVRAARSAADTAAMRSDFVSTVTHGLKTPVSVIRGVGETMIRGRVGTTERLREYAQLLVQESHRLTRLIDNMLTFARVTDEAEVYSFDPLRPVDVVNEVVRGCQRVAQDAGFVVEPWVSPTLPAVRADQTSLVLALDNLVDNAMRYSGSQCARIDAHVVGRTVEFSVIDHGKGIPPEDLARVQQRFMRGKSTHAHGSGLGLAIASRVARDHGGRFRLESVLDGGTTAVLAIPIAAA